MQAIKAIPSWTRYNQLYLANRSTTRTSPKLVVNYSVSVMKAPVSLQAVVDEIDGLSDDHVAYINLQTGELVTLSAEEISAVEEDIAIADFPEWQQALITKTRDVLASDDYLQLPTQRDIHEYAIMERFCSAIVDNHLRNILFDQIQGAGAFRRFKQTINHYGIAEDWYQYRANSLEAIAIKWLDANGIPYQRGKA